MVETAVPKKKKTGGLAGIVAGDSAICTCGIEDQTLSYRGYSIDDLAANATFEEVCWLLLRGELPNKEELDGYKEKLKALRDLPKALKIILEHIPETANMMDVLRTGVSALGNIEAETPDQDIFDIPDRLIACQSSILLYWYQYHKTGKRIDLNTDEDSLAGHIFRLLLEAPGRKSHVRCLDVSLILYAEHEFNASTFTARTIASTLPDFYSSIVGAIGALRGPLHGGANEAALELIQKFDSPDAAEEGIKEMLHNKDLIMGFGHRVYTTSDPRSAIIKEWAQQLGQERGDNVLYPVSERIEQVMWKEKKIFPNLDFYSADSYYFMGFPTEMFTPMFVFSRISGWAAHVLEQRGNNKLIRPGSNYTGPSRKEWLPISKRKDS
ncbi:MAG: 2-methylcitrate synthase [Chlamydiales bacterium]|jgi:2-methylcitrate synthase